MVLIGLVLIEFVLIELRSDSVCSDREDNDWVCSDRVCSDRVCSDRVGSDRVGSDSVGSDRVGSNRVVNADKFGPYRVLIWLALIDIQIIILVDVCFRMHLFSIYAILTEPAHNSWQHKLCVIKYPVIIDYAPILCLNE